MGREPTSGATHFQSASHLLTDNFDSLIACAEDVPRLNEAILQLAVQGKLVTQDPNDEPASELLKRIVAEKKRLGIKSNNLPEIGEEERPFPLPDGWEWVRLGEIGDWGSGATPSRGISEFWGGEIPWLKTGELNDGIIGESEEKITKLAFQKTSVRLNKPGDVLIAMYGATIGKLGILEIEATTNQACCACTPFSGVFNIYLFYYLRAMRETFRAQGEGGAQPNISKQKIVNTPFSLPPLAEQKRIVERVDSLLAQTRQLEAALATAVHSLTSLHNAAIQDLLTVSDPDEFVAKWQFIADNFDTLYDEAYPEAALANVDELKQAILQLAVQGKLTRQDPADEPTSDLLQRIAAEKKRLGIKSKKLPEIGEEERPYALPDSWEWIRLAAVSKNIHYGYTASADFSKQDYRLLRITDIQGNKVNWPTVPGCEIEVKNISKYLLNNGDILIARTGGTIGKSYLVEDISVNAVFASYLIRVIPLSQLNAQYIKLFLDSPLYWGQLIEKSKGTGQPNVNATSLSELQLPLPPLAEQKRIVTRINALLRLCDDLAAHLQEAQATHTALRDAALLKSIQE